MFSDGVSTISQMQGIIQGQLTSFSAKEGTLMGLVSAITSIVGCLMFLWIAKFFTLKTKTSLLIIMATTGLVAVWGSFGIAFDNFGIKVHTRFLKISSLLATDVCNRQNLNYGC